MKMVAAAKLRKAQLQAEQSRPYAEKMAEMLAHLSAAATETMTHPFFEKREVKRRTLVLVTSDRGLCGAFNANLIRRAEKWLTEHDPGSVELVCVGRRGHLYFRRRRWTVAREYTRFNAVLDPSMIRDMVAFLTERFISGQTDEIYVLYTKFQSTARVRVTMEKYLNIDRPQESEAAGVGPYIFEPDADAIFAALLPRYAVVRLQAALADSFASEHATRMLAMTMATANAEEMIDRLTLQYNKARQAAITKELLEVVSGAEALRG
jgi:F-type H+-transporting ATPase subunit gamma